MLDGISRSAEAHAAKAGTPLSIPFLELLPVIMDVAARFMGLLALCPKRPPIPPTPPLPAELVAVGVTDDIWKKVNVGKYAAMKSVSGDGFTKWSINKTAREIAKSKNIHKKAAIPLAIATLEAGRDKSAEELAVAAAQAIREGRAMGLAG